MSLTDVHARLAVSAVLFTAFLAIRGFWRYFRKQGVDSSFWGALIIGEVLILVQGGLGIYLWLVGLRPDRGIHFLYGVASALVIPGVWAFTRGKQERREMLLNAVMLLFLVGLLFRAIGTGGQ